MDINGFWQELKFRVFGVPEYSKKMLFTIPDGKRHFIDFKNITIGNLEWKSGWKQIFKWEEHPLFRWNKPWDPEISTEENITIQEEDIVLTMPKGKSKSAFLFSNFTIKYGTIRALIKCPNVEGAFSAFWLFGDNGPPEHDMFEHCGGWKNKVNVTHHWGYDYVNKRGKKSTSKNTRYHKNFKPGDNYYLYEIELTPYKAIYKINGVVVRTKTRGLSSDEQHLLINITKGNYCGSNFHDTFKRDSIMNIKFIEIFEIDRN